MNETETPSWPHSRNSDLEACGRVEVVLAPGKTGSTAIKMALRRAGLHPVLQAHALYRDRARDDARDPEERAGAWLLAHPPSAQRSWRVVTSVRDPIARAISRHFQDLRQSETGTLSTADCLTGLSQHFIATLRRPRVLGWKWYDTQLTRATGIDVFASSFDHGLGHAEHTGQHVRLFIVRQENLASSASALGEFFGIDLADGLSRENDHRDTEVGQMYEEVLGAFRPPSEYVDRAYRSRTWRHFYSAEEIQQMRAHWTRPQ